MARRKKHPVRDTLQAALYSHKWLLLPFYIGAVLALIAYLFKYIQFIFFFFFGHTEVHDGHLEVIKSFVHMSENEMIMAILTVIDMVMVANLVKMIITGSYQSFIDKVPENTEKVSSGLLKVKMGTSLIGITSIHLLQVFVNPPADNRELIIKTSMHVLFLLSSLTLAWIDTVHSKSELLEAQAHKIEHELHHDDDDDEDEKEQKHNTNETKTT